MTAAAERYRRARHGRGVALPELEDAVRATGGLHPGALAAAARRLGLPEATVRADAAFYEDLDHAEDAARVCMGTSCVLSGAPQLAAEQTGTWWRAYCVGYCDRSPALLEPDGSVRLPAADHVAPSSSGRVPDIRCASPVAIVTRRIARDGFTPVSWSKCPEYKVTAVRVALVNR